MRGSVGLVDTVRSWQGCWVLASASPTGWVPDWVIDIHLLYSRGKWAHWPLLYFKQFLRSCQTNVFIVGAGEAAQFLWLSPPPPPPWLINGFIPRGGGLVEVIQVTVPGFSDPEEVQVIGHDKIIQDGCFTVEGTSVMETELRMCCCATCCVLWGSRERLCKDWLTCFPFLMEGPGLWQLWWDYSWQESDVGCKWGCTRLWRRTAFEGKMLWLR